MATSDDTQRWKEVKRIFADALEIEPEYRDTFLDEACRMGNGSVDLELHRAVRVMLDADSDADSDDDSGASGGFLSASPLDLKPILTRLGIDGAGAPTDAEEGTMVGPYRIVRLLGRGGMGEVYLASRADGLFQRDVALKRVRADLAPSVAERFSTERQILADLVHPGIARLYAAGSDDDGRPWLAMEPVDGTPLPEYAAANGLAERDRVGLILQVCAAVQHAHQRGVVHRDIKPSNVLVVDGEDGPRAILLDFGIARILTDAADQKRFLTRAYAAPEQLRGDDATTATDIYAVGALLVETLAGRRVKAGKPLHGLNGDLAAVAAMALADDPAVRYASADALAQDLRRALEGRPVAAVAPTMRYRATRFVVRHRVPVLVTLLALALVTGAVIVSALRVTSERNVAQAAAADAEAVVESQNQILRVLEPSFLAELDSSGAGASMSAVVEEAVETVEEAYKDRPAVLARALVTLGTTLLERGELARADSLFARALDLRLPLAREGDPVVHEGLLGRGLAARGQGDRAAARAFFRRALELEREHPGVISDPTSSTELYLAGVLDDADAREGTLLRTLAERKSDPAAQGIPVALAHNELGVHYFNAANFRGAFHEYSQAEQIVRRLLGETHPNTNVLRGNLSYAAAEMGRYAEAERHARIALDAARRGSLGAAREATLRQAIGQALFFQGRAADAESELRSALAVYERERGADSEGTLMVLNSLIVILGEGGKLPEALTLARRVERAERAAGNGAAVNGISARSQVGAIRFAMGQREEAMEQMEGAYQAVRSADATPVSRAVILGNVGDALRAVGELERAALLQREALSLMRQAKPDDHWNVRRAQFDLGRTLAALGRMDEARPLLVAARGHLRRQGFPTIVDDPDAEIDRLLRQR